MAVKETNTAPLAAHAAKALTSTMQTYAEWLTEQTGYKVDPLSVQLGSALRGTWQAEQRAAKQAPAKAPAKKAPVQKATVPAKPRVARGATIATAEGVVIAEQRHIEAASA